MLNARLEPRDAERVLLGTLLLFPDSLNDMPGCLTPERFCDQNHGAVYATLLQMREQGKPITPVSFPLEYIKLKGAFEHWDIGDAVTLIDHAHPTPLTIQGPLGYVLEGALLREADLLARTAGLAIIGSADPAGDIMRVSAEFAKLAADYDTTSADDNFAPAMRETIADTLAPEAEQKPIKRVPTGIFAVDEKLNGGPAVGDLVVVMGRPGMGKTTAAQAFERGAFSAGLASGGFWMEMSKAQNHARWLASEAEVDLARLLVRSRLTSADKARIAGCAGILPHVNRFEDYRRALTVDQIRRKVRQWKAEAKGNGVELRLIVIDYLQLMGGISATNSVNDISVITKGLKAMAGDEEVVVVLLTQLNREVEKRANKRPTRADGKGCGAIEDDADIMIGPYRPYYYEAAEEGLPAKDREDDALWIILKHRMGPVGDVDVTFRGPFVEYVDRGYGAANLRVLP